MHQGRRLKGSDHDCQDVVQPHEYSDGKTGMKILPNLMFRGA